MKALYNYMQCCSISCGLWLWMISYLIDTSLQELVHVSRLETGWTLINQNESIKIDNLSLPSGVYSAYSGEYVLNSYNDVNLRWLSYDNWTYVKYFTVNPQDYKSEHVNLTFHGIDTVAEIRLNHELLGRTDNMFVRYSYDVTNLLEAENILEVEIKSPVYVAKARAELMMQHQNSVPPFCPPQRYHGECHMNMLRKMQASFAWDWGLAAPSMGIWKPVDLETYEVAVIRDVDIAMSKNSTHWTIIAKVFLDVATQRNFYAELNLYAVELLDKAVTVDDYVRRPMSYRNPIIRLEQAIPISKVRLWWPNGYGEQKLYPLHFTLNAWINKGGPLLRRKTISQKRLRVGFRTIELVEEALPGGNGNTFFFRVNGEDIFMKGSNYIPAHILPEMGADSKRIKHLLQSAKAAHMNMLRVWGGGIYESDYFYDLADEMGLLIWQDMMFACAMYPATHDFLDSVRTEVIQNAKRLAYHVSIAIFATNNENEVALAQNWYGTVPEQKRFESEYRELYVGTVMHELKIVGNQNRPTPLVSSPSNGRESRKDNYLSHDPQNPNFGDVHFYDVFGDAFQADLYPRPRFSSEYGFQSLPRLQSWSKTLGPNDSLAELVNHRQHHPLGMITVTNLVFRHFPLPLPEDSTYMEALVYFSQIAQAMATKTETELYRSLRDTEHRTMGALYWQLNDVWVAPSWSSIDFYGNFKLLQYWAKDFMAPVSIIALSDLGSNTINVSLVCDHFNVSTADLSVTMNTYLWSHLSPVLSVSWPATLKPNGVHYDKVIEQKDLFLKNFTKTNSFFEFVLQRGSLVLANTFVFPGPIKSAIGVQDPHLEVEISWTYCYPAANSTKNSYSLSIIVEKPAIFVYIEVVHPEVDRYELSRNGFMQLVPSLMVQLEIESNACIKLSNRHIKISTVNQYMK